MGGCCCSSRKPHLHGTPVYYYYPPALEEQESLTSRNGTASTFTAGLLVDLHLEASTPDTFRAPPAPLPYDVVFGCPPSMDTESVRETISDGSFETLATCEDIEDSKTQASSLVVSPRKSEVSKLTVFAASEEEDACPICLEEYDTENPKLITKCEHHFHLSCILEWNERSDSCPICDQNLKTLKIKKIKKKVPKKTRKIETHSETEVLRAGDELSSSVSESPTSKGKPFSFAGVSLLEPTELHHAPTTLIGSREEDYPAINNFHDTKYIICIESGKIWGIAGPIAFNILCNYGVNSFTNIFVGRIGDVELSAVAISLSVISNFAFGFLLGMASALETLCGQAFGAGQIELLGVYMQRSILILFVACFFLLPLYILATPILRLLGQREDIAELAGTFAIQVLPQMFSLAINFPSQKFLQAQSNVGVLAWIGFVALIAHIGILFLFINLFKWGTAGAAMAFNISAWGVAIAQMIYVVRYCEDGWKGLSWLALKDIWSFARLSIASAIMLCLELWYLMSIIVLTGHLEDPVIAVGSLSICMNINGWEGMLFIGINAAISVRVSNELGSAHPRAAKYSVIITTTQSFLIGIFCAIVILVTKDKFSIIFTDSKEMRKAVADLAYLLGITMLLNSVQPVISGVAVGGGWQALVAYINLFCYYVIGLPFGFLLGYKMNLGVQGIWIGMISGTLLQTLILLYIVYKTNWNKEVEEASERLRKWGAGQDV